MLRARTPLTAAFLCLCLGTPSAAQGGETWKTGLTLPGVDGEVVTSTVWDPDGNGPEPELWVVGGKFTTAGGATARNLAAWDGSEWRGLDSADLGLEKVNALTVYQGELIATGWGMGYHGAGDVWASDGVSWHSIGHLSGDGKAATVYNGELYVGGGFGAHIARWNGSSWGGMSGTNLAVYALTEHQGLLIAGGAFTIAGSNWAHKIAAFDGTDWSPIGDGMDPFDDKVLALASWQGRLIAGGDLSFADGQPVSGIAQWDGTGWQDMAGGVEIGEVRALTTYGGDLIAGGTFLRMADGTLVNTVAAWDGLAWSPLKGGLAGALGMVEALTPYQGKLGVGGWFTEAGQAGCENAALWDGSQWISTGNGPNGPVQALLTKGEEAYIGGLFTTLGGQVMNGIAHWDGTQYRPLGTGLDGSDLKVHALTFYRGELIVGGDFLHVDGKLANGLAKWDGTQWSRLGGPLGLFSRVEDAVVHDHMLYVIGDIPNVPGAGSVNHIAAWDGVEWHALGSGLDYFGSALCSFGGDLYAAGNFQTAGGVTVNGFARWDGSQWHAVPGSPPYVSSTVDMTRYQDRLALVGNFTKAGGKYVNGTALFDGTSWQGMGGGLPNSGWGMAAVEFQGDLIVAGLFSSPGKNIARWDGAQWHTMESGVNDMVNTLAVHSGTLFVGGNFTKAGGHPSAYVARWESAGGPWRDHPWKR